MQTFTIDGYRIRAHAGGKTEVYQGRRKLGVWWVSAPAHMIHLLGEDLEANARTALEAARGQS